MSAANKALARRFFEEADRGRTPVELCVPGFSAQFPGPPPMDLEGFDQFEAMIRHHERTPRPARGFPCGSRPLGSRQPRR
jgi:hypothetical protein